MPESGDFTEKCYDTGSRIQAERQVRQCKMLLKSACIKRNHSGAVQTGITMTFTTQWLPAYNFPSWPVRSAPSSLSLKLQTCPAFYSLHRQLPSEGAVTLTVIKLLEVIACLCSWLLLNCISVLTVSQLTCIKLNTTLLNFVASPTVVVADLAGNPELSLKMNDCRLLCHRKSPGVWTPL